MKTFKEFLSESITVQNAHDLGNLISGAKIINKSTLQVDSRNVKDLVAKLSKWGYVKSQAEGGDVIYKKGSSLVGISYDDARTKATVTVNWLDMKTFKEYILEGVEEIVLESESPGSTTAGVANPDTQPSKPVFKRGKFMGHPTIEVDDDTYCKCIRGKQPFERWSKYVQDEELRDEMRKMFQRNKKMLMVNSKTGAMAFVRW